MDASCKKHPVVAVVGPTATGKTALGVALAQHFSGEVISCDSMQIYKGLDVGTAKVTPEETCGIPHHGVDILTPDKPFSVADFTAMAGRLEREISARGALPILVGGTGLYVQSFLNGVRFTEEKAPAGLREQLAAELAEKGGTAMYEELRQVDPEAAAAIDILRAVGLRTGYVNVVSCPTCGRTGIDVAAIARRVESELADIRVPLTVAVMGCVVNGPGEAREADIGLAGGGLSRAGGSAGGEGSSYAVGAIFEKGKAPEKVDGDLAAILIERARRLAQERAAQA